MDTTFVLFGHFQGIENGRQKFIYLFCRILKISKYNNYSEKSGMLDSSIFQMDKRGRVELSLYYNYFMLDNFTDTHCSFINKILNLFFFFCTYILDFFILLSYPFPCGA